MRPDHRFGSRPPMNRPRKNHREPPRTLLGEYMYVHVCACMYVLTRAGTCISMYGRMCAVYICTCGYVYAYVCVDVYVYIYIYMHVCRYAWRTHTYVSMYERMCRTKIPSFRVEAMLVCMSILRFFSAISGNALIAAASPGAITPEVGSFLSCCRTYHNNQTTWTMTIQTRTRPRPDLITNMLNSRPEMFMHPKSSEHVLPDIEHWQLHPATHMGPTAIFNIFALKHTQPKHIPRRNMPYYVVHPLNEQIDIGNTMPCYK